jgi:hypothetical protein
MLSARLFSWSGELAAKKNERSWPFRVVVHTTAPFLMGPSCMAKSDSEKVWPETEGAPFVGGHTQ